MSFLNQVKAITLKTNFKQLKCSPSWFGHTAESSRIEDPKYDKTRGREALSWIEAVFEENIFGNNFDSATVHEKLKRRRHSPQNR